MAKGSYWQPLWNAKRKERLKYWTFNSDILYLRKPRDSYCPFVEYLPPYAVSAKALDLLLHKNLTCHYPGLWDKYWDYGFLKSRKTVAVDYEHFTKHAARGGM